LPDNHKEHRKNGHYQQARKEGYRARSAYKLLEIQKRFNIFKRAFYILDLGCAPGSWLQVSKKNVLDNLNKYQDQYYHRDHFKIMGIDLKKVSSIEDVNLLKLDFTKPEVHKVIENYFQNRIDLILSDASINKTGNKFTDQLKQIKLCFKILEIAHDHLKYKGTLVLKAFQGNDFDELIKKFKSEFRVFKTFKPKSSKKKSNEIYLIGLQKK
jgi:23S rRNA (uridine2552-2'-O)-methyltransferase